MSDDIIELIIYIVIGVVGLLASIYRNKQRQQAQRKRIPGDIITEPIPKGQPDLGPLAEILGIPEIEIPAPEVVTKTAKEEPSVEDGGYLVEEEGMQFETKAMEASTYEPQNEAEGMDVEKFEYEAEPGFQETKETLISAKADDFFKAGGIESYEPISASEIKAEAESNILIEYKDIDWKKVIIYSEILKRKEF
jgi:hypothetical protein